MTKTLTKEHREKRAYANLLRSCIRRAWSKSPSRYAALTVGKRKYNGPNKRQRFEHQCNICKQWFKQSDTQIDHVIPCGGFLNDDYTINEDRFKHFCYIIFCGELQKVCVPCHNVKTREDKQNALRE